MGVFLSTLFFPVASSNLPHARGGGLMAALGHAYTEAIANIRTLKKAFPDAILNHLFPELNKIITEIEY